jgi:hypothetical protein
VRPDRTDPRHTQHRQAGVVGVLGDRDERAGNGQDRTRADQQRGKHTRAHPAHRVRISTAAGASSSDDASCSTPISVITFSARARLPDDQGFDTLTITSRPCLPLSSHSPRLSRPRELSARKPTASAADRRYRLLEQTFALIAIRW